MLVIGHQWNKTRRLTAVDCFWTGPSLKDRLLFHLRYFEVADWLPCRKQQTCGGDVEYLRKCSWHVLRRIKVRRWVVDGPVFLC